MVATIFSILKCMFYSIVTYQEYFDGVGPSPKKGGGSATSKSATAIGSTRKLHGGPKTWPQTHDHNSVNC